MKHNSWISTPEMLYTNLTFSSKVIKEKDMKIHGMECKTMSPQFFFTTKIYLELFFSAPELIAHFLRSFNNRSLIFKDEFHFWKQPKLIQSQG
jgi:hypothetical protein